MLRIIWMVAFASNLLCFLYAYRQLEATERYRRPDAPPPQPSRGFAPPDAASYLPEAVAHFRRYDRIVRASGIAFVPIGIAGFLLRMLRAS